MQKRCMHGVHARRCTRHAFTYDALRDACIHMSCTENMRCMHSHELHGEHAMHAFTWAARRTCDACIHMRCTENMRFMHSHELHGKPVSRAPMVHRPLSLSSSLVSSMSDRVMYGRDKDTDVTRGRPPRIHARWPRTLTAAPLFLG